ncbi:MAG: AAA family ATPase [Saprospiraceae bacterium]|nr:AAA family ATPase [Saprospiraceae bacterium]
MDALGGNYKFKHLKIFSSTENLYQNTKKYRKVYDNSECRYMYAEMAFYNKLFDEKDWDINVRLVCTNITTNEQVCNLKKSFKINKDVNIFYVREGWGTPNPGWWKKGKYQWDAYIEDKFVGQNVFYITNHGIVSEKENPYVNIQRVRLFEGPMKPVEITKRRYLKAFPSGRTRYINLELDVEVLVSERPVPLDFQFNLYNDAGQHKAYMEYFVEYKKEDKFIKFDVGYGSNNGTYWFKDKYTLEIIFMDQRIGIVPIEVGDEEEEEAGETPFLTGSRMLELSAEKIVEETVTPKTTITYEEATAELKALIGLESVKKQIDELSTYLKFIQIRKEKGFKENSKFNLHTIFMGNPGTGKTTVAKMLGKIYKSLNLLSKGDVHEVGRVDLVGEFIGQTAPKVQKALDKARGGILFVDEAYALSDRGDDGKDFGKEVVEVLLKEMSDGEGDIAIVFAGYPKEMRQFMTSNPGMSSRIQSIIHFPDYTPEELMEISTYAAQKRDINFTVPAYEFLGKKVIEAYRNRDEHFGNARFVNGVIEECKQNMALRLMRLEDGINDLSQEQLSEVALEDVEKSFGLVNRKNVHIPIDDALFQEALAELHELIGLEEVKRDVDEMAKLVRYYTEIGRDVRKAFSLHTVFTGNPGTGKTTVARILVKIYKALGVLERGHLVECDRKNLVAGFVGQTAIKTGEMIEKAMGGGLFIDEAYALTEGGNASFGRESVNTILKMMEDHRGEFMVIVAGYPNEMRHFLESNPGLMSRFDRTMKFPDYSKEELMKIADTMFEQENLFLSQDAYQYLGQYIERLLRHKHKYFGNARTVRKVVKEVTRRQHLRLAVMPPETRTRDMIKEVVVDDIRDFKLIEQHDDGNRKEIGFRR